VTLFDTMVNTVTLTLFDTMVNTVPVSLFDTMVNTVTVTLFDTLMVNMGTLILFDTMVAFTLNFLPYRPKFKYLQAQHQFSRPEFENSINDH
jgi:uncharacterized membrane protein